jgi:predicted nuclease of restriction endonuclease-like (RecB) superfamily
MAGRPARFDFRSLVDAIQRVDGYCSAQAGRAVNVSLTLRNWLIGRHVAEFEMHGADRAAYGERLLDELSIALRKFDVSGSGRRQLYGYIGFYRVYPQIVRTLSAPLRQFLLLPGTADKKVRTPSAQSAVDPLLLVTRLAYSHLEQLVALEHPQQRTFYEIECLRGNWSVRELRRQIGSLYFERSGLSRDKRRLAGLVTAASEKAEPQLAVRDPYVFEFLGLKAREVMGESHLEDAILDKLQEFLLELGHGFCFEARQKRIQIEDACGFVDLVFYHRVLKCHVLVELKVTEFSHEHIGQLNTYVSWYRKHMMSPGDNPPVGILLCTRKNHTLVEYALAGMNNRLFVSKYQVELPDKRRMRRFLLEQVREVEHGG